MRKNFRNWKHFIFSLFGLQIETVLKGVVRSERLDNPADFVATILDRVKKEHIQVRLLLAFVCFIDLFLF